MRSKRLVISWETIRRLSTTEFQQVAGGRTILCDSNTVACTGNNCTRNGLHEP